MDTLEVSDIIRNQHIALNNAIDEYERTGRQFPLSLIQEVRSVQYRLEILEREVKEDKNE